MCLHTMAHLQASRMPLVSVYNDGLSLTLYISHLLAADLIQAGTQSLEGQLSKIFRLKQD